MKKFILILLTVICFDLSYSYAKEKSIQTSNDFTSSCSLLVEQSATFIKKYAAMIALTPLMVYYHKNCIDFAYHHPFISTAALYCSIHYISDCILEYKKDKPLFECVPLIKKIALDLVICHGIQNSVQQKNIPATFTDTVPDQNFFDTMTQGMNYSFDQIELMTMRIYTKLRERLSSLHHPVHIESEEFVFLCHASSIDMQTMLYLTKDTDQDLYLMLSRFEQNPQQELLPLLKFLRQQLQNNFIDIQQRLAEQDFNIVDQA